MLTRRPPNQRISRYDLDRHLDAFFTHVYPINANAVVNRAELYNELSEDQVSPILIKAICAVSARFLEDADNTHPDGGALPYSWARECRLDLMDTINVLSEAKIVAALLLSQHEANSGRYASGWILVALALRMAFAMRLNAEAPSPVAGGSAWRTAEARRRIMWCAFVADRNACGGIPELTLIRDDTIKIPLPVSNHFFDEGIEVHAPLLGSVNTSTAQSEPLKHGQDGILARYCRLMAIRGNIL